MQTKVLGALCRKGRDVRRGWTTWKRWTESGKLWALHMKRTRSDAVSYMRLYLGNLAWKITEQELELAFAQYGVRPGSVRIIQ